MNAFINALNSFATQWFAWHVTMFWQVGILLLIVLTADTLIKNRAWPQVRYALWLMLVLKLVLPPSFALDSSLTSGIQPVIDKNIEIKAPAVINTVTQPELSVPVAPVLTGTSLTGPASTTPPTAVITVDQPEPRVNLRWQSWLMLGWVGGLVALAGLMVGRVRKIGGYHAGQMELTEEIRQLVADCSASIKLRRVPRVIITDRAISPFVYGIFRPTVILPADSLTEISPADLRHHLLHELAHIKRGDLLVHGGYVVVQLLYWFNPLVWIIGRQVRHLREICCDTAVAAVLKEDTKNYRQTLLETARRLLAEPVEPTMGLLGLFEDSSKLLARLQWLEKPTWKTRKLQYTAALMAGVVMVLCVLPMAQGQEKAQNMQIEAPVSQWQTVSSCKRSLLGDGPAVVIINGIQWFAPSAFGDGQKTFITINHPYKDVDRRIVTKTTDGNEVITEGGTTAFNGNICTMQTIIDSPADKIESFSLQIKTKESIKSASDNGQDKQVPIEINSDAASMKVDMPKPTYTGPDAEVMNYLQHLHEIDNLAMLDNILRNHIGRSLTMATDFWDGADKAEMLDSNISHVINTTQSMQTSLIEMYSDSPITDTLIKIINSLQETKNLIDDKRIDEAVALINEMRNNQLNPLLDKITIIENSNPSHELKTEPTKLKGFYNIITSSLIQYDSLNQAVVSDVCRMTIEELEYSIVMERTPTNTKTSRPYHAEGSITYKDQNYDHTGYKSYIEGKDENQKLIRCEFITIPGQPSTISLTCELDDKESLFREIATRLLLSDLKKWPDSLSTKIELSIKYQAILSMCDMYLTIKDSLKAKDWAASEKVAEQVEKVINDTIVRLKKEQKDETPFQIQIVDFYAINAAIKNHNEPAALRHLKSIDEWGKKLKALLQDGTKDDSGNTEMYIPQRIEADQHMLDYFAQLKTENRLSDFEKYFRGDLEQAVNRCYATAVKNDPKNKEQVGRTLDSLKYDTEQFALKFPTPVLQPYYDHILKNLEEAAKFHDNDNLAAVLERLQNIRKLDVAVIQSHLTRIKTGKPGLPFFPETKLKGYYKFIGTEMLNFDTNDFQILGYLCDQAVTNVSYYDNDYLQGTTYPGWSSGNDTSTGKNGIVNGMKSFVAGNDKYGNKFRCEMIVISGQPVTLTLEDSSGDNRLLNELFNQLSYSYLKSLPDDAEATPKVEPKAQDDKQKVFYEALMAAGTVFSMIGNAVTMDDWATAEREADNIVKLINETIPKIKGEPTEPVLQTLMTQFNIMHEAIKAHDKEKALSMYNMLNAMGENLVRCWAWNRNNRSWYKYWF